MRILTFILIFSLGLATVFAQEKTVTGNQDQKNGNLQLKQKMKMVNYMLNSPVMSQRHHRAI